jgi:hypothetical protein
MNNKMNIGQSIIVTWGMFKGQQGYITQLSGKNVTVMLTNKKFETQLSTEHIEKLSMTIIDKKICECAALLLFQSYNRITLEDAFEMAIGEAEVYFNSDITVTLTSEHKYLIEQELNNLT